MANSHLKNPNFQNDLLIYDQKKFLLKFTNFRCSFGKSPAIIQAEKLNSCLVLFQILFDQAQRSVKQQLHNFVKE